MNNLKNFQHGDDPRRNLKGRPRKLVNQAKELGYTTEEVKTTLEVLIALTKDELKEVLLNENSTMLELIVAASLKKAFEKGSLFNLELLLTRAQGKPKETINQNLTGIPANVPTYVQVISSGIPLAKSEKEAIELYI